MLDKAYRYLLDQGFGIPELASLDLDEVPAMARQHRWCCRLRRAQGAAPLRARATTAARRAQPKANLQWLHRCR